MDLWWGHITPEGMAGGPIALVKDDDMITLDAISNTMTLHVSEDELNARKAAWTAPAPRATSGLLYKYAKQVATAAEGCITDK